MILLTIFNQLETAAHTAGAVTYELGVKQLKNNLGSDDYPLIFIELPVIITNTEIGGRSVLKLDFVGYAVYKAVEKDRKEEYTQIAGGFDLARRFLNELAPLGYEAGSYLTYSGIELSEFSDMVNGVRFEFSQLIYNVC